MGKETKEFIAAVGAETPDAFIELVQNHLYRKHGYNLEEILQSASRKDLVAMCEGLQRQAELGAALFDAGPGEEPLEDDELTPRDHGCSIMAATAIAARLVFEQTKPAPPEALLAAAAILHDRLLEAREYPELQDEVCRLCLEWWLGEGPERAVLTVQTVPCLLGAALRSGTAAAVKRCHAIRTAMELFDFDDPSIADLKGLLLRAAFAPAFLRAAEGRRFLAYLFTLQPSFVRELTAIVKNQVPAGRRSVLDAYGEILYRAWSSSTGACLLEVKNACIQDLMEAAILASSPALASALRRVLGGLHSQKHQPGVDAMLLELYEPILFRRLNAANPAMRRNALELLFDAFPLRDPEESVEAADARMTDQFAALSRALKDEAPSVRAAAVSGVGRVLATYWELIPGAVTAGYVKTLATELAFDSTAPNVRAAVAEALTGLVECPLAHRLLGVVLPRLAPQLYDPSPRVRAAFVDLLLVLRGVKELPWAGIVDAPKLLEVMAVDVPAVCTRVQRLLLPTFFPDSKNGPALVAGLLRTNPEAGRAFCFYLAGAAAPGRGGVAATATVAAGPAIAQHCLLMLIKDLAMHLIEVPLASEAEKAAAAAAAGGKKKAAAPRTKRKKKGEAEVDAPAEEVGDGAKAKAPRKRATKKKEEEEVEVPVMETPAEWEAILGGVVAASCGLAAQIASGSMEADSYKGLLPGDTFSKLLERCPSADAREDVVAIAAALPLVPGAADVRAASVELLGRGDAPPREIRAALDAVAAHPASRVALVKALSEAFGADPEEIWPGGEETAVEPPQRGKRRKFEKHSFVDLTQAAAVALLGTMLELDGPRAFLLSTGVLGRLLPLVTAAVEGRAGEVAAAVAGGAGAEELEGRPEAGPGLAAVMRAGMHLMLASQPGSAAGGSGNAALEGADGDAASAQGVTCLHQAVEWAFQMLKSLESVSTEDIVAAVAPPAAVAVAPAPKRSRGAKGKAKAKEATETPETTATDLSPAAAAIKEAFMTGQTCVAVAAEAARLRALGWPGHGASWAPAAASVAQTSVSVLRKLAAVAVEGGADAAQQAALQGAVLAGVSHAARLARNLAAAARSGSGEGARDLDTELAAAAEGETPSPARGTAAAGAGGDTAPALALAEAVMEVLCKDTEGIVVNAARGHLAGLLSALNSRGEEEEAAAAAAHDSGRWLSPVAAMLAAGVELDAYEGALTGTGEGEDGEAENREQAPGGAGGKSAVAPCADVMSFAAEAPLVKQLAAAAKLVRASEAAAGQAAALAAAAAGRGDASLALGAAELAQVFGFQGITVKGKSRAGAGTYAMAIRELGRVRPDELAGGGPAAIALANKIAALFPHVPRVAFDEIFN